LRLSARLFICRGPMIRGILRIWCLVVSEDCVWLVLPTNLRLWTELQFDSLCPCVTVLCYILHMGWSYIIEAFNHNHRLRKMRSYDVVTCLLTCNKWSVEFCISTAYCH
jgi:hypothetical protein